MRDFVVEMRELRCLGMATARAELVEQGGNADLDSGRWLAHAAALSGIYVQEAGRRPRS